MQSYEHFKASERKCLEDGIERGESLRSIAKQIGKNVSSVSRELKRNSNKDGRYNAYVATNRYIHRRRVHQHPYRLERDEELCEYVVKKLKLAWSPEAIVCRWKKEHPGTKLGFTTIYRSLKKKRLKGCSREENLRRHGKKRYCRSSISKYNTIKPEHTIHERPKEIEGRERIGDWEGDTVAGKRNQGCITTLVDRKTRYLVAVPEGGFNAKAIKDGVCKALEGYPVHSITFDNGSEFASHAEIAKALNTIVYFADPHSPWQRGTNENTNGILRFFFPKGTNFIELSAPQIEAVVELINNRPRKCLDWLTPREAFFSSCCT